MKNTGNRVKSLDSIGKQRQSTQSKVDRNNRNYVNVARQFVSHSLQIHRTIQPERQLTTQSQMMAMRNKYSSTPATAISLSSTITSQDGRTDAEYSLNVMLSGAAPPSTLYV